MKLNNLSIRSFRGATKPLKVAFDPAKTITMIFGENGNGKTTIADALVCLCTDGYGSVEDKTSVDKSYLCSVDSNPQDVLIELDTDIGKFKAELNARPLATFTKSPAEGMPNLRFLRRKQIIDLLDDQPSKRYERLQEYIDVAGVMASEDSLRKLIRTSKSDLTSETKSLTDSTNTLERIWEEEGKPMSSWEDWAKSQSTKDITKESERHAQLSDAIARWQNVFNKLEAIRQQKEDLNESSLKVEKLQNQLSKLESAGRAGNTKLLAVLESAHNYIISEQQIEQCPVCKNSVKKDHLAISLKSQIESMKSLQKVSRELDSAIRTNESSKAVEQSSIKEFNGLLDAFCSKISGFVGKGSSAETMIKDISAKAKTDLAFESCLSHLDTLNDFMEKVKEKAAKIYGTIKQFNAIKESYKTVTRVRNSAQDLNELVQTAEKTLKIVESTRKKFIEDSLNSVSAEIEDMYGRMHPGEGLGDIKLFLKETGKNSIEITSSFHTIKEITPQSLYSESHLDTLGICIFIALAKKFNQGNTILLLDDVMMSVDDRHLDRFIKLLHLEADHFDQIVITTHYRPWRDRYRTHRAPAGKVHFVELRTWTKELGITIQNGRVELQELELALDDKSYFDRQIIASKSGILLENLLEYLTDIYEYHMPKRKTMKYTLGELMDALQPKYLKNIKVVHKARKRDDTGNEQEVEIEFALQPAIDELKKLMFIRNQVGAHFNLEQDASDDDVLLFGKTTLELGEMLICKETGQLPLTKSSDHWKSQRGTVKLFPADKN